MTDFVLQPRFELPTSIMGDFFGIWAIHGPTFRELADRHNGLNLNVHMQSAAPADAESEQRNLGHQVTPDGIAMLSIRGPMMKTVSSLGAGTSTIRMRQQLRSARKNTAVAGAFMLMDTPGGTVRGNEDLVAEVARFAEAKPIFAFTEDMTASAGVSVASQATKRFANNATALYGAMGTYGVLVDYSGQAEKLGVKVHVIQAGDFKGMGEPGTEITPEQLAEAQRIVDRMNENYLSLIAKGLGKPLGHIRSLADGRVILASDAVSEGLIDGIQSFDETYAQLGQATRRVTGRSATTQTKRETTVSTTSTIATERRAEKEHFSELVEAAMAKGIDRQRAIVSVARKHPRAHQAFLAATHRGYR